METNKLKDLKLVLEKIPGLVLGFSGGVDSSLLAVVAHEALGNKMLAVTVASVFCPAKEIAQAKEMARKFHFPHVVLEANPLSNDIVTGNPPDRCYHCKKMVFGKLLEIAKEKGFSYVADGSNLDDRSDYRPGMKAIAELQVVSPLLQAGLTKADIRQLSKELGLPTWSKESAACLASRVPYGEALTKEKLERVDQAEEFLSSYGFTHLRVRSHGQIARLEVGQEDFSKLLNSAGRKAIVMKLKELGFLYITLDLEGYRMGSLNEVLHK